MRLAPRLLAAALTAAACACPARRSAAPPVNDNYLASLPVDQAEFSATADTTEATTQPDLFNPNRDGQPLGGGAAETTACKGTPFGKTVWYDLAPQVRRRRRSCARAGFHDGRRASTSGTRRTRGSRGWSTAAPTRAATTCCSTSRARSNYTIQVGGAGGAGGALTLQRRLLPGHRRRRRPTTRSDKCTDGPGHRALRRLPAGAEGRAEHRLRRQRRAAITITRLIVDRVPKGAKVVAKCSGCGSQTVKAKRLGRVSLTKLVGKNVRARAATIEIRVTMAQDRHRARYGFGATGSYFKWPVRAGGLGARLTRCLEREDGQDRALQVRLGGAGGGCSPPGVAAPAPGGARAAADGARLRERARRRQLDERVLCGRGRDARGAAASSSAADERLAAAAPLDCASVDPPGPRQRAVARTSSAACS